MPVLRFDALACPLDLLPLSLSSKLAACANRHTFDFAQSGTINLLPVQFKSSKSPGDSLSMVHARRDFLNTGFFQSICDHLLSCCTIDGLSSVHLVDAGCGEGYYTSRLKQDLLQNYPDTSFAFCGFDISKEAIQAAVKRDAEITWMVATNKRIPIQDNSCDVVLSIFGFPVYPEFHRILKPNSQLLLCHQGPDHLIEIRQILYPTIKDKPTQNKLCPFSDYFSVTDHSTRTEIKSGLSADMLAKLVHMTPHAYRATRENLQKLYDNPPDTLTVQSVITSFRAN